MQNNIHTRLRELHIPKFIIVAASTILGAIFGVIVDRALQNSLNNQSLGYYLMAVVALVSLILVIYFLIDIEEMVQNRNYTRFITSKADRLNLMTYRISNAEKSIFIISDLSGTAETQLEEHVKYLKALNQVIVEKKVKVQRIVVPVYASGRDTEVDSDWIYKIPVSKPYLAHFNQLRRSDGASPKYNYGPCSVSMILIDNKYLFWKPEITLGNANLNKILDGGLYLEDYTREGIADFAEQFRTMFDWSQPIDLERFGQKKT